MGKCLSAYECNVLRNHNAFKGGICKGFCLNRSKCAGQNNGSDRGILKRASADNGNLSAEIKLGKIDLRFVTDIFDNSGQCKVYKENKE